MFNNVCLGLKILGILSGKRFTIFRNKNPNFLKKNRKLQKNRKLSKF